MKEERDRFEPAERSIFTSRSGDSVMDVFSFILLLYYLESRNEKCGGNRGYWKSCSSEYQAERPHPYETGRAAYIPNRGRWELKEAG